MKKFKSHLIISVFALAVLTVLPRLTLSEAIQDPLEAGWERPPLSARLRAYWWWLNGNVSKKSITHDLEEMKAKGFGGAVIIDAGGADQWGNAQVPHGPDFLSPRWRELYKHALREAERLGLEMSLNIQSGWNLGGPMVKADDAAKKLVWTESTLSGQASLNEPLLQPASRDNYYKDLFVVAYRLKPETPSHPLLQNWAQKALVKTLEPFSAPDSSPLFQEFPSTPGEEGVKPEDVVDLSGKLGRDGKLNWTVPAGIWQVIRFGCTIGDHSYVSTSSEGWKGYALDVFDAGAFTRYWDAVVKPLIKDAGPLAGRTLKYLHTDSWEVEAVNWTPTLRTEFKKRRGYDMVAQLPALAGHVVDSRDSSDRFLADFRKTLGDLAIDNHYRLFRDKAHRAGLEIHPESGGPHAVPIDAQRCLGWTDVPMSEFWAWSWTHRIGDENRYFMKQPASAAHTYGHKLVQGEGFTTIGPHWQETIWDNLKPSFDKALCEGLNRLVWHAFVSSPEEMGMPGQQYFAGTHFNPNVTWWEKSGSFLAYINRCQFLMQQGLFVADVCYYYGDHVPNFARLKKSDPAKISPGYDYDVITEEALLTRMSVDQGRLVLPDGMSYRVLVLPDYGPLSLPVSRKVKNLVAAGAIVVGPRMDPLPAREVLLRAGVKPDFEFSGAGPDPDIDYIHRVTDEADIYFVANRSKCEESLNGIFRVSGKAPEIWDAVSGEHHTAAAWEEKDGRISMPLAFQSCGSLFVIFRKAAGSGNHAAVTSNSPSFRALGELGGAWTLRFEPRWGGPEEVVFEKLVDWTSRPEPGIKYYSGTTRYLKTFDLLRSKTGKPNARIWLDLGKIRELAELRLNGKNLGIVWTPPFRVDITEAVKESGNQLEIEVVNFWPNRIIGDQGLPESQRLTKTNITNLTKDTALMESGLLGPVRVLEEQ